MTWLANILWTSIGKKLLMAVTGLCFCAFLAVHLAGNLTLYRSGDLFIAYSQKLHQLGGILTIAEWTLAVLAVVHVVTGVTLFYGNLRARPVRYRMSRRAGGRTLGSATMPYTGFLLLAFVTYHLLNFHFAERADGTIFEIVAAAFREPAIVLLYVLAMIVTAIHINHGFWSAIQSIGGNHPKYTPIARGAGILFSLIVGFGFGLIPVYVWMNP